MELRSRSSRSRSNTPSLFHNSEHEDSYVTQSVRITRSSKIKHYEESHTSESVISPIQESMEKSALKTRFVTSDYSSDDGENEVSSSLQNFKNQTIESTSRTKVNGEVSALKIYRQAGEYWNKYPKTDYTYSHHSKDRVEISPGVIQMPNMSRKSLRNSPISNTSPPNMQFIANKACSTDSFHGSVSTHDYSTETIRPRNLFSTSGQSTNNNSINGSNTSHKQNQQHYTASSATSRYSRTTNTTNTNVIVRIWQYLVTWSFTVYEAQSRATLWAMKRFYRFACWVMLMDRWLLKERSTAIASSATESRRADGKVRKLLALCGIPLLLLGGWFLIWGLTSLISNRPVQVDRILVIGDMPPNHPNFNQHFEDSLDVNAIASALTQDQLHLIAERIRNTIKIHDIDKRVDSTNSEQQMIEKILQDPSIINIITNRVQGNIHIDSPSPADIASVFTQEQLSLIAQNIRATSDINPSVGLEPLSEQLIVERLLQNPEILNVINRKVVVVPDEEMEKKLQTQQIMIERLQKQLDNMHTDFWVASKSEFRRFEHQLQRCCRNSFIATEKYVMDILKDVFQAPSSLNKDDFGQWLRSVFVARDDLESRIGNLTLNLNDRFDAMVTESGRVLMDQIALKIRADMLGNTAGHVKTLDDEYVRKIVKGVLAVYDADKTGLVDYALESSGAEVLSTKCTETYQASSAVVTILGVPIWYPQKSPRTVLTPSVNAGDCWAFQSFPGYVVIQLSTRVHIEAVSYEHLNKLLMPNGRIDSAPKHFAVYGVNNPTDNSEEPVLLGEFMYDADGDPLQFFTMPRDAGAMSPFHVVELRVLTNHGNPKYTCLYRFRVHGKPA